MTKRALLLLLTLLLAACSPAPQKAPAEVVVAAAASLTDALKEAKSAFEAEHPAVRLRFTFGSSGALQAQIEQGAPVDLFISAATGPMDALVKKGLVEEGAVQSLATNEVVLIGPKGGGGTLKGWEDLPRAARVAIGNPQHVPAGQYGRATLEKLNLWAALEPKLVLGEDVRQVLQYVESGEVDAGIVYRSDAAGSQKVLVIAEAPANSHPPILYPMAVLKEARRGAEARGFADFLRAPKGMQILARYGFSAPQ
jgi:molybdate transport system substrate-binding protein